MHDEDFKQEFAQILEDCENKYEKRKEKYGNGWYNCDLDSLWDKLNEEFKEYHSEYNTGNWNTQYAELIDIINVALMLAERTRRG